MLKDTVRSAKQLAVLTSILLLLIAALTNLAHADQSEIATPPPDDIERYALVVGIDEYTHLGNLRFAVNDATLLKNVLEGLGYTVIQLENYGVSAESLKKRIVDIGEQMDAGSGRDSGTLLISFSGHGYSRDGRNYLALGDALSADDISHSLPVDELKATMRSSGIGRQFLFLDACRNIPVKAGDPQLPPFVASGSDRGLGIIYSAEFDTVSYEDETLQSYLSGGKKGQGVFSYYLATALRTDALYDDSGELTLNSVYDYVRSEVAKHVYRRFNARQIPYRDGESTGDLAISRRTESDEATTEPVKKNRLWTYLGIAAGIAAVVILSGSDSGSEDTANNDVTLVIPTP